MGPEDTSADALAHQIDEIRKLNRRLELENAELRKIVADHAEDLSATRDRSAATERELADLRRRLGARRYQMADMVMRPLDRRSHRRRDTGGAMPGAPDDGCDADGA